MNTQYSATPESTTPHHTHDSFRTPDAVPVGEARSFDVDGRDVVIHRTSEGFSVVSEGRQAAVIRPVEGGLYVITGATGANRMSEPAPYGEVLDLALERLGRRGD